MPDHLLPSGRVVIDGVRMKRVVGRHARTCCACEATIAPGEERYIPDNSQERTGLVDGRKTRMCVPCVEKRFAGEGRSAA